MIKKELFTRKPEIKTYPNQTNILSTYPENNLIELWILENSLNIFSYKKCKNTYTNFIEKNLFVNCPFIHYSKIYRKFIKEYNISPIGLIEYFINNNQYVFLYLNHKYLKASDVYMKEEKTHDVLIYGYDNNSKEFMIADFFKNGIYSFEKCSYDEFTEAYVNAIEPSFTGDLNGIITYYFDTNINWYQLNTEKICFNLKQYLEGKNYNDSYSNKKALYYGINCYKTIFYNIKNLQEKEYLDKRGFSILKSHKIVIKKTLSLLNFDIVDDELNQLILLNDNIINLVLKYNISKEKKYLIKIVSLLLELRTKEKIIYKKIIKQIKELK